MPPSSIGSKFFFGGLGGRANREEKNRSQTAFGIVVESENHKIFVALHVIYLGIEPLFPPIELATTFPDQ